MNKIKYFFSLLFVLGPQLMAQIAIPCGHSHNDYLQKRPLYEAIELGYGSIEIDICLDKNNQLKVAHNPWFLDKKKTIEEMYLNPISKMIDKKDTSFRYSAEHPLTLIIDIKTNSDSTYYYLKQTLLKYKQYITQYNSNTQEVLPAPLKISLTGGRPVEPILQEGIQLVKIDNGLRYFANYTSIFDSIKNNETNYLKPKDFIIGQINLPYMSFFTYRGIGKPNEENTRFLTSLVHFSHQNNKSVRLYAAGNNKKIWKYLLDAGVDWINVDNLKKFAKFYRGYLIENLPK